MDDTSFSIYPPVIKHGNGKSPILQMADLMGKSSVNGGFSVAMFDYWFPEGTISWLLHKNRLSWIDPAPEMPQDPRHLVRLWTPKRGGAMGAIWVMGVATCRCFIGYGNWECSPLKRQQTCGFVRLYHILLLAKALGFWLTKKGPTVEHLGCIRRMLWARCPWKGWSFLSSWGKILGVPLWAEKDDHLYPLCHHFCGDKSAKVCRELTMLTTIVSRCAVSLHGLDSLFTPWVIVIPRTSLFRVPRQTQGVSWLILTMIINHDD